MNINTEDMLRINKDLYYINEKITFLKSDEAKEQYNINIKRIVDNKKSNYIIGHFYCYKSKNIIDGRSGIIIKLSNNSCILVEVSNTLIDSLKTNDNIEDILLQITHKYFNNELSVYGHKLIMIKED